MNNNCPYLEDCPFFNDVALPDFAKEAVMKKYCLDNGESCARKVIKDRGETPPHNLVPDGRIIASKNDRD